MEEQKEQPIATERSIEEICEARGKFIDWVMKEHPEIIHEYLDIPSLDHDKNSI